MPEPVYLGDGLYASHDGFQVALHSGSHESMPVAYLEPEVFQALVRYGVECGIPVPD